MKGGGVWTMHNTVVVSKIRHMYLLANKTLKSIKKYFRLLCPLVLKIIFRKKQCTLHRKGNIIKFQEKEVSHVNSFGLFIQSCKNKIFRMTSIIDEEKSFKNSPFQI